MRQHGDENPDTAGGRADDGKQVGGEFGQRHGGKPNRRDARRCELARRQRNEERQRTDERTVVRVQGRGDRVNRHRDVVGPAQPDESAAKDVRVQRLRWRHDVDGDERRRDDPAGSHV